MKNNKIKLQLITTLFVLIFATSVNAQIRLTPSTSNLSVNGSSFIDASSNVTNNNTVGTGKGLVFPRTDLSTFTFVAGATGLASNYPNRYDGMIVYNTKVGGTANVGTTSGTLTAGFWYYENKSTTVTGGTWKPLGGGSSTTALDITSTEKNAAYMIDAGQVYTKKASFTTTANSTTMDLSGSLTAAEFPAAGKLISIKILNSSGMVVLSTVRSFNAATRIGVLGDSQMSMVLPVGTYTAILEYTKS